MDRQQPNITRTRFSECGRPTKDFTRNIIPIIMRRGQSNWNEVSNTHTHACIIIFYSNIRSARVYIIWDVNHVLWITPRVRSVFSLLILKKYKTTLHSANAICFCYCWSCLWPRRLFSFLFINFFLDYNAKKGCTIKRGGTITTINKWKNSTCGRTLNNKKVYIFILIGRVV